MHSETPDVALFADGSTCEEEEPAEEIPCRLYEKMIGIGMRRDTADMDSLNRIHGERMLFGIDTGNLIYQGFPRNFIGDGEGWPRVEVPIRVGIFERTMDRSAPVGSGERTKGGKQMW